LERLQEQAAFFGIPNPVNAREAAEEAAAFTREILSEPFTVHTSFAQAPSGGSGERYYAFIELADGSLLSEKLVAAGWARVSGEERKTPDGIHHLEQKAALEDLQLIAAVNRRGTWKYSDFTQLAELREEVRAKEAESEDFRAAAMGTTRPDPGEPLDLNRASLSVLKLLPGIGEVRAAAIVKARPFTSVEDLLGVHGIGPKTVEALTEYVTVGAVE
jgi:DNA uptake protein ComE-like DNA-binding protein